MAAEGAAWAGQRLQAEPVGVCGADERLRHAAGRGSGRGRASGVFGLSFSWPLVRRIVRLRSRTTSTAPGTPAARTTSRPWPEVEQREGERRLRVQAGHGDLLREARPGGLAPWWSVVGV